MPLHLCWCIQMDHTLIYTYEWIKYLSKQSNAGQVHQRQVELLKCVDPPIQRRIKGSNICQGINYCYGNQMQVNINRTIKDKLNCSNMVESIPCRLKWLYRGPINQLQVESIKCRLNGSTIINAGWMDQIFVKAIPCRSKSTWDKLNCFLMGGINPMQVEVIE